MIKKYLNLFILMAILIPKFQDVNCTKLTLPRNCILVDHADNCIQSTNRNLDINYKELKLHPKVN